MFSTSSPHAPKKDQQRHTSFNSLQCSPSISSPYHLSSCTHTMANGRKLDGKDKVNQAKYPQKSKDHHVLSKIHVQEKKNMIQKKIRRPQRLKIKSAKIMWIPKLLNEAMNLKENFKMASNLS